MFACSALNSTANSAVKELGGGGGQTQKTTQTPTKKNPNNKTNHEATLKVFAHSVSCNTVELGLISVFLDMSTV